MDFFKAEKDPNAYLDYTLDWSSWLPAGDTIVTSTWILPAGLTLVSSSNTATTAIAWLKGGVAGQIYLATNRITTLGGRIDDRSIRIEVKQK